MDNWNLPYKILFLSFLYFWGVENGGENLKKILTKNLPINLRYFNTVNSRAS